MQGVKGRDGSAKRKSVVKYKKASKGNEEMTQEDWSPKREQRNKISREG